MLENTQLTQLISQFPSDVQAIFTEMIPAYQLGYVDYVYQTDKVDVQARRIRNLVKNFRTMDYFYVMPLTQDLALEIANKWKYPSPYDFYDMTADPEDYDVFISEKARGERYFAVIRNGFLLGYYCFEERDNQFELGLGMKPDYTGKGLGKQFYQTIESHFLTLHQPSKLTLSVAAFNERAVHLYQTVGFREVGRFEQETNGGFYPFIKMEKTLSPSKGK